MDGYGWMDGWMDGLVSYLVNEWAGRKIDALSHA